MLVKRKYLFGTTILAGVVAMAAPAFAQTTTQQTTPPAPVTAAGVQANQDDDQVTEVEEIVVTGSRIRRDPTTSPTPLIQVDREQLTDTGLTSVIDYLATIPALSNSQVPSDTTAVLNASGLSLANLRSLGAGRTLTLVDGRRHVSSSQGQLAVDVDTIPRLLIESVEIITGGASSVYGADAVAGVLNFILRKDFEGVEIDARYREINQDGQANMNFAALVGQNFLDDRLNLYVFGEYDDLDRVRPADIDWLRQANVIAGVDADPATAPRDAAFDNGLFSGVRTLSRPRWGVTVLGNQQRATPSNDPDVTFASCATRSAYGDQFGNATFVAPGTNCFNLQPGQTFVYEEGGAARQANFGTRIGIGLNPTLNIGGDGENPNTDFSGDTAYPKSESKRFQTGANFALTDNINLFAEAKFVTEDTELVTQPAFGDVIISNLPFEVGTRATALSPLVYRNIGLNEVQPIHASTQFTTRLDNAFLPANVAAAILGNTYQAFGQPTATLPGQPTTINAAPYARHRYFANDRRQYNNREVERYVVGGNGEFGDLGIFRDAVWDLAYTFGKMNNTNREEGIDALRFGLAQDAVVDSAGLVNGRPGEIVCRAQLIAARGAVVTDYRPSQQNPTTLAYNSDLRVTDPTAISQCAPLNVFGRGVQSQAALDYTFAQVTVREQNEQQNAVGSVSASMWDLFGAGAMGIALGAEYRREETSGVGRDRDTRGRFLLLNTGEDAPLVSYESKEAFAEISLPLMRDSWLGEYAELSGSYRYADYNLFGESDVYGVNFVYRPIEDLVFKTSFNTSFRIPSLFEGFRGRAQTFANGFNDPCDARTIFNLVDRTIAAQRITNCTAVAAQVGITNLSFDLNDTNDADGTTRYLPNEQGLYGSGSVAGFNAGNPALQPETADSFTFTVGMTPRFIPNFSLVLDYYEITIDDVIQGVTAGTAVNLCVNGPTVNQPFCDSITRSSSNFTVRSFVAQSFNYAKRSTRGLDFTANYSLDTEEVLGRDLGAFNYRLTGSWLIEQKTFNNISNPNDFTESAGSLFFPRVRLTSQLAYQPIDPLTITWTVDWQTSQDINNVRDLIVNTDFLPFEFNRTGNFARHDFGVSYQVRDDLRLSGGVTNAFDEEQAPQLGGTLYSNFDPYGRRFNIGLNYTIF